MKNKGFTLTEVLICVALIGLLGLIVVGAISGGLQRFSGMNKNEAQDQVREFADDMGLELVGATCQNVDSDANGYVSCTVRVREEGKTKMLPLECATRFSFNEGCRLAPRTTLIQ
jgi:prepilin-type N-terminal cleavage/methylation domain-containing protein